METSTYKKMLSNFRNAFYDGKTHGLGFLVDEKGVYGYGLGLYTNKSYVIDSKEYPIVDLEYEGSSRIFLKNAIYRTDIRSQYIQHNPSYSFDVFKEQFDVFDKRALFLLKSKNLNYVQSKLLVNNIFCIFRKFFYEVNNEHLTQLSNREKIIIDNCILKYFKKMIPKYISHMIDTCIDKSFLNIINKIPYSLRSIGYSLLCIDKMNNVPTKTAQELIFALKKLGGFENSFTQSKINRNIVVDKNTKEIDFCVLNSAFNNYCYEKVLYSESLNNFNPYFIQKIFCMYNEDIFNNTNKFTIDFMSKNVFNNINNNNNIISGTRKEAEFFIKMHMLHNQYYLFGENNFSSKESITYNISDDKKNRFLQLLWDKRKVFTFFRNMNWINVIKLFIVEKNIPCQNFEKKRSIAFPVVSQENKITNNLLEHVINVVNEKNFLHQYKYKQVVNLQKNIHNYLFKGRKFEKTKEITEVLSFLCIVLGDTFKQFVFTDPSLSCIFAKYILGKSFNIIYTDTINLILKKQKVKHILHLYDFGKYIRNSKNKMIFTSNINFTEKAGMTHSLFDIIKYFSQIDIDAFDNFYTVLRRKYYYFDHVQLQNIAIWIAKNIHVLRKNKTELNNILDWIIASLNHNYEAFNLPIFNIKMSYKKVIEISNEWHKRVFLLSPQNIEMNQFDPWIDVVFEEGKKIIHLKTSLELHMEGKSMHHCVGSYIPHVNSGRSQIYHCDFEKEKATLELIMNENNKIEVRQLYGYCNSTTSKEMKKFINNIVIYTNNKQNNDT